LSVAMDPVRSCLARMSYVEDSRSFVTSDPEQLTSTAGW